MSNSLNNTIIRENEANLFDCILNLLLFIKKYNLFKLRNWKTQIVKLNQVLTIQ